MVLIGIDPGLAHTGWGIVSGAGSRFLPVKYGVIETKPSFSTADRLKIIADSVRELTEFYQPEAAFMEALFFARNRLSAIPVAQACGVILAELSRRQIPVKELTPIQIKQSVTGDGRADKQAVQIMVQRLLGMSQIPKPDHAADALAAAIAGSRFSLFERKAGIHV